MSHLKERKEKNCLNCNAQLRGKYCYICGQENTEPKESVWYLVNHLFQDITHFDGKFFSSVKYIITRPGFLPREYMKGRRASYLNPVRLYLFTSAFFFLVFFTFFNPRSEALLKNAEVKAKTTGEAGPVENKKFLKGDTKDSYQDIYITDSSGTDGRNIIGDYRSRKEYDSLLQAGSIKDNWFSRQFAYKQIDLNRRFTGRGNELIKEAVEAFMHKLPQMLFISLPLLALLLKLLYLRRKEFYYVSHVIFSIDLYIFIFIAILCTSSLEKINASLHRGIIDILEGLIIAGIFFYFYRAMHNFYGQGRAKTILKFLVLNISFLIIMAILFIFFLVFTLFTI